MCTNAFVPVCVSVTSFMNINIQNLIKIRCKAIAGNANREGYLRQNLYIGARFGLNVKD